MADYISIFSGSQMDDADTLALNPDAAPTLGSGNLVTSDGIARAVNAAQYSSAPAIVSTASGAVCAFPDGSAAPMTSVIAEIVASQAGSGTPYPAGGGKNKLPVSDTLETQTISGVTFTVNRNEGGAVTSITANGTATAAINLRLRYNYTFGAGNYILTGGINANANIYALQGATYYTDTGNGAAFTTDGTKQYSIFIQVANGTTLNNLAFYPMIRLASEADATFAPYSNIRPITGYTGANVTRAGRNMLNEASLAVYTNWSNTLFPYGSYPTNSNSRGIALPVKAGVTYMLSFGISADSFPTYLYLCRGQGETSERLKVFTNTNFIDDTFSFTAEDGWLYYIRLGSMSTQSNFETNWAKVAWSQMELGATPTGHVSYAGEVFSVSWQDEAGTVYFGYIDLVSGLLTVTHKAVDLGTLAWAQATSGSVVYFRAVQADKAYGLDNILCSCYQQGTAYVSSTPDCSIAGRASSREVIVKDSAKAAMTAEEFGTAVSGQTLVYELTTAETYTLSGQIIEALYGDNTLWNNVGGNTTAKYRADTKKYIQSLLGA